MKIRLRGTEKECAEAVERLRRIVEVVAVSRVYRDGEAARVYVEVRL